MKATLLVLLNILLLPGLRTWSQDSFMQPSLLYNVERPLGLNTLRSGDTTQITKLIKAGNRISSVYPDRAVRHFRDAFSLSQQLNYNWGMALALLNMASYCLNHKK